MLNKMNLSFNFISNFRMETILVSKTIPLHRWCSEEGHIYYKSLRSILGIPNQIVFKSNFQLHAILHCLYEEIYFFVLKGYIKGQIKYKKYDNAIYSRETWYEDDFMWKVREKHDRFFLDFWLEKSKVLVISMI